MTLSSFLLSILIVIGMIGLFCIAKVCQYLYILVKVSLEEHEHEEAEDKYYDKLYGQDDEKGQH